MKNLNKTFTLYLKIRHGHVKIIVAYARARIIHQHGLVVVEPDEIFKDANLGDGVACRVRLDSILKNRIVSQHYGRVGRVERISELGHIVAVGQGNTSTQHPIELKRRAALGHRAVHVVHVVVLELEFDRHRRFQRARKSDRACGLVQQKRARVGGAAGLAVRRERLAALDEIAAVVVDYERLEDDRAAAFHF